jgi:hypothetical protein
MRNDSIPIDADINNADWAKATWDLLFIEALGERVRAANEGA